MKIVLVGNERSHEGGVVQFLKNLEDIFLAKGKTVVWINSGTKWSLFYAPTWKKAMFYPLSLIRTLYELSMELKDIEKGCIIVLNPSMLPIPLLRDLVNILFLELYSCFSANKEIVVNVIWHGWDEEFFRKFSDNKRLRRLLDILFTLPNNSFVLTPSASRQISAKLGKNVNFRLLPVDKMALNNIGRNVNKFGWAKFLFLSRISVKKGFTDLLAVWSARESTNSELSVVGHFEDEIAGERYQREMSLHDSLAFHGRLEGVDKYNMMDECDVLILPSHTEGCPNVIAEALSRGLAILACDVGAISEQCSGMSDTILFDVGDREALAKAIRYFENNIDIVRENKLDRINLASDRFNGILLMKELIQKE